MPNTKSPELIFEGPVEEHVRKVALIVQEILVGKTNNYLKVSLEEAGTTTVIENSRINIDTVVSLTPTSEAASSASVWVETTKGRATIHHGEGTGSARTYSASLIG